MAYLLRRLRALLADLESGRLHLAPDAAELLKSALDTVRYSEAGEPVLESVSHELRALARTYDLAQHAAATDPFSAQQTPQKEPVDEKCVIELTRRLFELQEELFVWTTGKVPEKFAATHTEFAHAVREIGSSQRLRRSDWSQGFFERKAALATFYHDHGGELFQGAQQLVGLKMVLGGKQSFGPSGLSASRSTLLYTDTLLVPDSVARWLEVDRPLEAFRLPRMLEDMYGLLQLKPLVDADLPHPALVVFPSMEGTLEESDVVTQDGQELMVLDLFSHYLKASFDDVSEIHAFATRRADDFVKALVRHRLFIGFGGKGDENFATGIQLTRDHYRQFRAPALIERLATLSDAEIALIAIRERLAPQYHLAENAMEFGASPLMPLAVHWHYSELLGRARATKLEHEGVLSSDHGSVLRALNGAEHHWLGNVPIPALVDLRRRGENAAFRKRLKGLLDEIGEATTEDLNRTVNVVARALSTLLADHDRDVRQLAESYKAKYAPQAVASWITLCASMTPWFPALATSAAALALGTTYLGTKAGELVERRRLDRTLTGVLAASARAKR